MEQEKRTGRATSSQFSKVCSGDNVLKPNKPFYTYAEEVALERLIKRSLKTEVKTQPMKWGSLMEVVLFNKLDLGWTMEHKNTIEHNELGHIWSGTPDLLATEICGEAKCYEPKKFGLLSMCLKQENVLLLKKKFPDEYWQVLSNCELSNKSKAMIITFLPEKSELEDVIDKITETDFLEDNNLNLVDYYFMNKENIDSLPYLPIDSELDSVNKFIFDVPEEDIEFIKKRVTMFETEVNRLVKLFREQLLK